MFCYGYYIARNKGNKNYIKTVSAFKGIALENKGLGLEKLNVRHTHHAWLYSCLHSREREYQSRQNVEQTAINPSGDLIFKQKGTKES